MFQRPGTFDMRTLAVIPARGGSKGIKQKNLQILAGLPLVAWSIKQAQASAVIDYIHVSTDDPLIQQVSKEHGASCEFLRPADFSGDRIGTTPAVISSLLSLKEKGHDFDIIVELQPTYCFRGSALIFSCVKELIESKITSSIISASRIDTTAHPDFAVTVDEKRRVIFGSKKPSEFARQFLRPTFACQGVVFAASVGPFLTHQSFYVENHTQLHEIKEKIRAFDINDLEDLTIAEHIAEFRPELLI